jgi:hypothetical protein
MVMCYTDCFKRGISISFNNCSWKSMISINTNSIMKYHEISWISSPLAMWLSPTRVDLPPHSCPWNKFGQLTMSFRHILSTISTFHCKTIFFARLGPSDEQRLHFRSFCCPTSFATPWRPRKWWAVGPTPGSDKCRWACHQIGRGGVKRW